MDRPLTSILKDSVRVATMQLEAGRKMDHVGLASATALRQDLLFEMEILESNVEKAIKDPVILGLLKELKALDIRLGHVLHAALHVFNDVMPQGAPPTYGANGRLARGYR